ncbi:uncharacterized protein LOC130590339 [Beta vulgaris subsp. vulgaris]|uniref:uncharacterized protein LOC130590339 n=1 Tax=Beta vulgaris subsp. vulgaris TaxID=3555 RepID=UPI002546D197|nr:uncharacterized protein LOC130590339 [Beta vulgaris subsp. vulgaris]
MLSDDGDCDGGPSTSRYEWGFAFDPPVVGDNLGPESSAAGNLETISGSLGSLSRTIGSSKVKKSRRKRVTRASARIRDKEFNVQLIPREYPNFKSKLMKFIYAEKPDANAEEVVMVKCGTLVATLEECKTVLGGKKLYSLTHLLMNLDSVLNSSGKKLYLQKNNTLTNLYSSTNTQLIFVY